MAKKQSASGRSGGRGGGRNTGGTSGVRSWYIPAAAAIALALSVSFFTRRSQTGEAQVLPPEPPLRPEALMSSMQRVKDGKSISLSDIGQQLRFFCGDVLDAMSKTPAIVGGSPSNEQPPSDNCKTFSKSLPQVAKTFESTGAGTAGFADDDGTSAEQTRLDRRLANLMRFQVDFDALQPLVLRLADLMQDSAETDAGMIEEGSIDDSLWPPSLIAVLVSHLIHGDDQLRWERRLVGFRQARSTNIDSISKGLPLLAAVACQATLADHAWYESPEEEATLDQVERKLEANSWRPGDENIFGLLALFATYRPLLPIVEKWSTLAEWQNMYVAERKKSEEPAPGRDANSIWPFWQLWRMAVEEPLTQRALRGTLGTEAVEQGSVSGEVRAMYEVNPYPKWSWVHPPMEWPDRVFDWLKGKSWNAPPDWPSDRKDRPKVLVAGCGTGHWLTHFARHYHGHADIWAFDLSLSSLSFAARKANELGLTNINFMQGDILAIPEKIRKEGPFDFIESGGVLHHLRDPREGWSKLVDLLRPGGVMLVALYSKIARSRAVDPCRDFARAGVYDAASATSLRRYRHDVHARIDTREKWAVDIASSKDFASLNGVRDLCLHIQETQYTLLEIDEILRNLGLRWLQMQETIHDDKQRKFRSRFGFDAFSPQATLQKWHEFETLYPTTFLGMYEFFVQR